MDRNSQEVGQVHRVYRSRLEAIGLVLQEEPGSLETKMPGVEAAVSRLPMRGAKFASITRPLAGQGRIPCKRNSGAATGVIAQEDQL